MNDDRGRPREQVVFDLSRPQATSGGEGVREFLEDLVASFAEMSKFMEQQEDTLEGKNAAFLKFPNIMTAVPLIRRFYAVLFSEVTPRAFVEIAKSKQFQEITEALAGSDLDKIGLVDPELPGEVEGLVIEAYRKGRDLGIQEKPDIPVQSYGADE